MYEWKTLEQALTDLGDLLRDRGHRVTLCVVGGGALNLLGLIRRATEDSEPTGMLVHGLPEGFLERCTRRAYGTLVLLLASRLDQIHLKLYAAAHPRDKHYADLRALTPTRDELTLAAGWVRTHVTGEGAEAELAALLRTLGVDDV